LERVHSLRAKHIPAAPFCDNAVRFICFMPAGFISLLNHCDPVG